MSVALVEKLIRSFDDLETCIDATKQILSKKQGVPLDVLDRVRQYSKVVEKQRSLASELQTHFDRENWQEVTRHIKIINGLSAMIREDAQAILAGAMQGTSSTAAISSDKEANKEEDALF